MSLIYTSPTSRHNLYLGGKADAKSLSTLQQRNVKRILNVTPAKEAGITAGVPNFFENSSSSKIKYKRISVYDASTSDLLSHADEMVEFISNGLHHGGVLVHCQRGVSRSATAVIMFLMRKANMTMKQALGLCQRRRTVVDPIPAFLEQLSSYERECRSWGYLTSVDGSQSGSKGSEKKVSEKDIKMKSNTDESFGGEKRKADKSGCSVGRKKRAVGPEIGPAIGPPRGPVKPAAIGPVMGPSIGPQRGPMKPAAIGPAMGPSPSASLKSRKIEQTDADGDKSKDDGKGKDVKVGPSRPPVKAICPMKPPA